MTQTATSQDSAELSWRSFTIAFQAAINTNTMRVFAYQATFRGPDGESADCYARTLPPEARPTFDLKCRLAALQQAIDAGIMGMEVRLATGVMPLFIDNPVEDAERMLRITRRLGFPTDKLVLEFGERDDYDSGKLATLVEAYQKRGFTTAFNQFGTGDKGWALLSHFTPDTLKLPGDLVHRLSSSWSNRLVVENIVDLATRRNIKLIADDVENRDQFDRLRGLGVPLMQGDYLSPACIGELASFSPANLRAA